MQLPGPIQQKMRQLEARTITTARHLWRPLKKTRAGRFAADTAWGVYGLAHGFRGESINLRAGNLTFISIFSFVPMLTVALALLHLLGAQTFQLRLSRFIQDILAPGIQAESAAFLQKFINTATSKAAGGVSFFLLMVSAGMLLRHLDASLNEIWAVRKKRPLMISIGLYAAALILGPVVLAMTLAGTTGVRNLLEKVGFAYSTSVLALGSAAFSVFFFTLVYKFAPHAPVRLRSALAGGIIGGLAWEVARHGYASFAALAFNYNPLYGSLSAAPLFLMWIYVSWWLMLFGARVSYAVEHAAFRGEFMDLITHPRARELVAARVAQLTAVAFADGTVPPTIGEIAERLRVPAQMVGEVVDMLSHAKLVVVGRRGGIRPAKDLSQLTLADVSAAVGGRPAQLRPRTEAKGSEFQHLEKLFLAIDELSSEQLSQVTWENLVAPEVTPTAPASTRIGFRPH